MKPQRHATILFIFAGVILVCVFVFVGFLSQMFSASQNAQTNTNATENSNTTAQPQSDPFVTVVPKEVLGGKPQPLATDPQRGATKPKVTLVEFGDFECDACARMDAVIDQIVEEYPDDVLHVWKDFPIPSLHPHSEIAAQAARCAADQDPEQFWPYHDRLLAAQDTFILQPWVDIARDLGLDTDEFATCVEDEETKPLVVQSYYIARTLSVEEAPTYYINDRVLTGEKSFEELKEIIDNQIKEATQTEEDK